MPPWLSHRLDAKSWYPAISDFLSQASGTVIRGIQMALNVSLEG